MRQEPKRKDKSQKWFFPPLCCSWDNPRQSSWDNPGLNETCVMTSTKMQRDCCFVSPCCLSVCLIRICIQADTTPHKLQVHVCVCVMGFYPTPPIRTHRQQTQTLIFLNKISNKLFPNHSKQLNVIKLTGPITSITRPQLPGKQELQDESLESNKETQTERQNLIYSNCCLSVGIFYYNRYQSQYIEGQ